MFDITQFAPADTSFLHLKSPVDEDPLYVGSGDTKQPVGITFHSPGSEAYEAAGVRRANRSLARGKKNIPITAELLRSDNVRFLADITASFDNLGYPPAADAQGTDLYKALYSDRKYGWVVDQATAHTTDWGNALKKSPAS